MRRLYAVILLFYLIPSLRSRRLRGEGQGENSGKKTTGRLEREGKGAPLPLPCPNAFYAGYLVPNNQGRGCVLVLNLVLALSRGVGLFCPDKISSFTAREKRVRSCRSKSFFYKAICDQLEGSIGHLHDGVILPPRPECC